MRSLSVHFAIAAFTGLLLANNCGAVSGKPVEMHSTKIVVHQQSAICGKIVESQWITNQQQLEGFYQSLLQDSIADAKYHPPAVNFKSSALLLISMGQQRTGGYVVKLASELMSVSKKRASVSVHWISAKSGMVTIQMLTNPCLLLELPRGDYDVVDIVDQSGTIRQSIAVN